MAIELTHYDTDLQRNRKPHPVTNCRRDWCGREPFGDGLDRKPPAENAATLVEALHSIDQWNEMAVIELLARTLRDQLKETSKTPGGCTPSCWTPVNCPSCGNQLPPRGRSVPLAMTLAPCCDEARMSETINPRHLWNEEEAPDGQRG